MKNTAASKPVKPKTKTKTVRPERIEKAASPETPPAKAVSVTKSASKTKISAKKAALSEAVPNVEPAAKPVAPKPARRPSTPKKPVEIPSILLEGDAPAPTPASGPGQKYALGPTPPVQNFTAAELPEAYGTKRLFLAARDPHWLYAHWDLTREQQVHFNGLSSDGHLVLRIYTGKVEGHPTYEIHVHPESRHWFTHVERAGNSYIAELGYYSPLGRWERISTSSGTVTPPDAVSAEHAAEFATIPFEFPFLKLMDIVKSAVLENLPLAQALEELRRSGHPELPKVSSAPIIVWTPQQEQALAKVINIDEVRRVWMGSLEITELIRRKLAGEMSSMSASQFGLSSITSMSSPFGGMETGKGFWFNVNAELIVYGATEPNAKVTLGGHPIKLRPDGTFSFRFSLPDGEYELPAVAVSADGTDARAADLKFTRDTQYLGDVGAHPQDPSLKPPAPENI